MYHNTLPSRHLAIQPGQRGRTSRAAFWFMVAAILCGIEGLRFPCTARAVEPERQPGPSQPTHAEPVPPPGGPADCQRWPRNPDKDCVGYAILFQELAGEGKVRKCEAPLTAESVARQMWDYFTGKAVGGAGAFCDMMIVDGQTVGLTSAQGITAVTTALQSMYSHRCVAYSRINQRTLRQGGNELGARVDCDKLPVNQWISLGCVGERTYSDKTQAASLHAVNVCKAKDGTIWVFDNNDSSYHPCTYNKNGLAWTSDYAKPGRPMGEATQCYSLVVDLRTVLIELGKAVR